MKSYPGLFLPDSTCDTLARTTLMVSANCDCEMFSADRNCFRRVFIVVTIFVTNVANSFVKHKQVVSLEMYTGEHRGYVKI